jgi:glyoxylase-like metal-dependent hydrolase (beta-lactamase superfamily II)
VSIPLEDNFTDVLGKAMRGLGLSDSGLAAKSGVAIPQVKLLRGGEVDENALRTVAPVLGLNAGALVALARGRWQPRPVDVPGLLMFNTPFGDMTVNAYLAWDRATREAVAFDTGADCTRMLAFLQNNRLTLRLILLTHSHGDHVFELDRLREKTGAPAFISTLEPLDGAETFDAGKTFTVGGLTIQTRQTWGHSRGGITYVVCGLACPVVIVGDAIFAASMGGGVVSYVDALRTNREEILTLPDDTVLCPGHGPMTTVGEEKAHNPFFA